MTKSEVLNIAVKIFGLYYFVKFIQHFMNFLFMIIGNSAFDYGVEAWFVYSGIFISMAVELTFSYLATLRTELITNRITKADKGMAELAINKTDLLEITLAAIAVLAIVFSVPDILYQVVDSIYFQSHKESEFWTRPAQNQVFQAFSKLIVGIFLLLNSRNFAKKIVERGEHDDDYDGKN